MNAMKETPLVERHKKLGGKMVEFAGWLMPVQYGAGIIQEHLAVRRSVGLFDVSHMGEIAVKGRGAGDFVDMLGTNKTPRTPGRVTYTPMCYPHGGIVDDVLVYCMGEDDYVLVVNAANVSKDYKWIAENAPAGVSVVDDSPTTAQIAIQGPSAVRLTCGVLGDELASMKRFTSARVEFGGGPAVISRTGYTGEDGFEVYTSPDLSGELWDALMEGSGSISPEPVGLGARDTLRFEASYRLYGNDIDETTDPLEAGLGWTVKMDKDDFFGKGAIARRREEGPSRKFVGLELNARRIARKGYPILAGGEPAGAVTSGAFAPHLEKSLAMGYLRADLASPGTAVEIDVKGRKVEAFVVKIPFLKASSG
jgi:aminomethyltransferase